MQCFLSALFRLRFKIKLHSLMKRKERELEFSKKEHDAKLEKSLDKTSVWLIRVVGVIIAAMGVVIVGAFWYWLMKMLFKVGA